MTSIHPLTVHFPIALVVLWPLFDAAGLLLKRPDVSKAAVVMLMLAVVASLVSTATGQSAFEAAVAARVDPKLLNTHADDANLVPWALLSILAVRTGGVVKFARKAHVLAIVLGLAAWGLIYTVGTTGGALVFQHRIGVEAGPVGR